MTKFLCFDPKIAYIPLKDCAPPVGELRREDFGTTRLRYDRGDGKNHISLDGEWWFIGYCSIDGRKGVIVTAFDPVGDGW